MAASLDCKELFFSGPFSVFVVSLYFLFQSLTFNSRATLKTWTRTLGPDPEKPGINIGLQNMFDFRKSCFIKTMRNVIYCLKVRVLKDI